MTNAIEFHVEETDEATITWTVREQSADEIRASDERLDSMLQLIRARTVSFALLAGVISACGGVATEQIDTTTASSTTTGGAGTITGSGTTTTSSTSTGTGTTTGGDPAATSSGSTSGSPDAGLDAGTPPDAGPPLPWPSPDMAWTVTGSCVPSTSETPTVGQDCSAINALCCVDSVCWQIVPDDSPSICMLSDQQECDQDTCWDAAANHNSLPGTCASGHYRPTGSDQIRGGLGVCCSFQTQPCNSDHDCCDYYSNNDTHGCAIPDGQKVGTCQ